MPLSEDWRYRNECFPFEDENNHYIVVNSEYETPGNEKEKRLSEARTYGVFKLLQFFGKDTTASTIDGIDRVAEVKDWYVAYRPCVRMKVLVSVPKSEFESAPDDPSACALEVPEEGYLSLIVSVGTISALIDEVTTRMKSLMPLLVASDQYISNVNIGNEIKRLSAAGRVIQRYINLNNIPDFRIEDPDCVSPEEMGIDMEIGFSLDYKALFALVDPNDEKEQYTIGYHCLLDNKHLNHITTVNYLLNLDSMLSDLRNKDDVDFNYLSFLTKYTLPTPILRPKSQLYDGVNTYDDNGNLFSFANLAKLITLDLDINLCKTEEERLEEERILNNERARREVSRAARESVDEVGNDLLTRTGVEGLKRRIEEAQKEGKENALISVLYNDVMDKVDLGCALEETIQCIMENMITTFGQEVFNDPDLERVINVRNVSLGGYNDNCNLNKCDGTLDLDLKFGFPVFQGVSIPSNLPISKDFFSDILDEAIVKLYNTILSSLSSIILGILENLCELLFSLPDGVSMIGDGLKNWFATTMGIDVASLNDPQVWQDSLLTAGGDGFVGIIGTVAEKTGGAFVDAYTETGISLNIPNPETGQVEEKFISPEFLVNFFSELSSAVSQMEVVLTAPEYQSMYRGDSRPETLHLAYQCVTRNGSVIFDSEQTLQDTMMGLGKLLQPSFLTYQIEDEPPVASDVCDLSEHTSLRKSILREKGGDLSNNEIDEIINKEKERKKKRLLDAVDTLELYKAGNLVPAFPNIYGKNGLIPSPPPQISELSKATVQGALGPAILQFNADASNYTDIWRTLFGLDTDGTNLTIYGPRPKTIFDYFNGGYSYNYGVEIGNYLYGYGEDALETADLSATPPQPMEEIDVLGGTETYLEKDFGKNFKKSEFEDELARVFFDGDKNKSPDVFNAILDFIEKWDDNNGLNMDVFQDPVNPLIFYSVTVLHEGGRFGSDRQTDAILIKTEYQSQDQQTTGRKVTYDYGEFFGSTDKKNLTEKIKNANWEGPLANSAEDQEGIVKLANNDLDGFMGYFAGVGTTTGGATFFAYPLVKALGTTITFSESALLGSTSWKIGMYLTGTGVAVATVAIIGTIILATVISIVVFYDQKDFARRIIYPEQQGGYVYVYDVIVSDKDEKVQIIERKISESMINRNRQKSANWPNDIVTVTKQTEVGGSLNQYIIGNETSNRTTEYVQDYRFGRNILNLGLKENTDDLIRLGFSYETDEKTNLANLILGADTEFIPASSKILSHLVRSAFYGLFDSESDSQIINDIRLELIRGSYAINDPKVLITGPASELLIQNVMQQLIVRVKDDVNLYDEQGIIIPIPKYWLEGYENGNFSSINLSGDILNYSGLQSTVEDLNQELYNAYYDGRYCDTISVVRRVNACQSLLLLIRLYIVEQAMTTIQVFDKFDLAFMDSDIFATNILTMLFNDSIKYDREFLVPGVDSSLYGDLVEASKKYYEILELLGLQERIEVSSDADYLTDLIRKEAIFLKPSIVRNLALGESWSTWDAFLTNRAFPTYDAPANAQGDKQISTRPIPPDNVTYEYQEGYGYDELRYNVDDFPPTKENIDNFKENVKYAIETYRTGAGSPALGVIIPDQTGLIDKLLEAFDSWSSTFSPALFEQDIISLQGDTTGEIVREQADTIDILIGDVYYKADYAFEARTQYYTAGAVQGKGQTVGLEPDTTFSVNITFDGDLGQDIQEEGLTGQAFLDPYLSPGGGFQFETYVSYKLKKSVSDWDTEAIIGYRPFLQKITDSIFTGDMDADKPLFDIFEYIRFGYRMMYIADVAFAPESEKVSDSSMDYGITPTSDSVATRIPSFMENLTNIEQISQKQKAFILSEQTRVINGMEVTFSKIYSIPIAHSECEYVDTLTTGQFQQFYNPKITLLQFLNTIEEKYTTDIFNNIKAGLLETDEYKNVINEVLTLKELISSLSFYEYAALSDVEWFVGNVNGINLHNIASRSKLATLQTFYASIYGGGKVSYQDPFTKEV